MKLFDTATKSYIPFVPGPLVKIYVCGITPYDSAHLGHLFTFMTYDLLVRRLQDMGHEVQMVRNVTDVDEPIYKKARELGISYSDLATAETKSFQDTLEQLHFRRPFAEPLASEYVQQMAEAVKKLLDGGYAYELDGDVYYDTEKYGRFGQFSGFNHRLLLAFMADRGGDPERLGKKNPLDFLLWKGVSDPLNLPRWESVVGIGRPGWHIECTVMSSALLGDSYDIHGGGSDLIYPHHESEIAQSYGLSGKNPAKIWTHVSPMLFAGEKMSKSLGNLVFAKDLLKDDDAAVIRLALMHYHHRIGGEWQPELLCEGRHLYEKIHAASSRATVEQAVVLQAEIRAALDDDLNTIEVINAFYRFIGSVTEQESNAEAQATVRSILELLGLV